ncbi:protein-lysine N-methyltransferase EFM [Salix suchowensis]|nr:protein-lysine N-methyltransferase EFM [Salix suchowensis]
MASEEEAAAAGKLERFLQWLQVNKAELRGCNIKYCDQNKGFGVFSSNDVSDGVLLVVPLDLAITPMRVLQDPLIGPECRAMFEEGEVDDRFLMILFLMLERLRNNSSWKPYLDMLPSTFGNPLWFTDDELLELKGTTLYRATELQRKKLLSLYEDKAKGLVQKLLILDGDLEIEVCFEDFLWANSVFWTRALNIPLPRSYIFPQVQEDQDIQSSLNHDSGVSHSTSYIRIQGSGVDGQSNETVWVEGLVPGIDFCNHNLKAVATWEVDGTGMTIGVPQSMSFFLQLLCLDAGVTVPYGFVIDNNPDEYLMVMPLLGNSECSLCDSKMQLLEAQKAEMRCLLPKRLLAHGFFPEGATSNDNNGKGKAEKICSFSWSGQRRMPSYINKLVFPEEFLTALRTIAMQEDELFKLLHFLKRFFIAEPFTLKLVGSEGVRQPTDTEVKTAVWEACGDSGALQLLFDLLQTK